MERKKFFSAKNIAYFAVLLAIVVVFQCVGGFFKIGATSLSFVLVPIVLGAILLGPLAGGLLGFAFGFIVLMYGVAGADPFTNILVVRHPVLTTLTCLVKGVAAGVASGWVYRLIARKNMLAAVMTASAVAPIVNTGLFIVGALTMSGTISSLFVAEDSSLVYFLFIGCAGWNFLIEFAIDFVLSPALHRVVLVVEHKVGEKKKNAQEEVLVQAEEPLREIFEEVELLPEGKETQTKSLPEERESAGELIKEKEREKEEL